MKVSYYDRLSSVVRLSLNFSHFHFLTRTTLPISTKLVIKHLWVKGIEFVQRNNPALVQILFVYTLLLFVENKGGR